MKTTNEIRSLYLDYFRSHGHEVRPSSPLVPEDDGLMFTNSGMYQFKPYFTRKLSLPSDIRGLTSCQKCLRTNDLDEVGHDGRHLTFFEMLGNFSFGTVTRREMCEMGLDFSCRILGLDRKRIHVSVYEEDDETYRIWLELGIDVGHIIRLGEEDNFWSVGKTGPCGPCTELYYDMGEGIGCGQDDCRPGCSCDRFLEYWNIVFTSYDRQEDGTLVPLPGGSNIDTGMGLERISCIVGGQTDVFSCGELEELMDMLPDDGGKEDSLSHRRHMSDHVRSITMLVSDGVTPSNTGRGYVLRKLIRRTLVSCQFLSVPTDTILETVGWVCSLYDGVYGTGGKRKLVDDIVSSELRKFEKTLDRGEKMLLNKVKTEGVVRGDTVFKLHDTYGLPKDVTLELCRLHGMPVCDMELYDVKMGEQRGRGTLENSW